MYALLLFAALLQPGDPVLVYRVEPEYPPAALEQRIQGVVKFTAVIDTDGRVQRLTLVSGHPLLREAARAAVRQWRYRPAEVRGKPVRAPVTIFVPFRLPVKRSS